MNTFKKNLLQRVRVVAIALVAIIGVGGVMAMKPTEKVYMYKYAVIQTPDGLHWEIEADVTAQQNGLDYDCNATSTKACTVFSNSALTPGSDILINSAVVADYGDYRQQP